MDLSAEVESAISGTGTISKADYVRWIRQGDLATRARVYALTASHWSRIQPAPQMAEHCAFMADYFLECLQIDPDIDDFIHSGLFAPEGGATVNVVSEVRYWWEGAVFAQIAARIRSPKCLWLWKCGRRPIS